MSSLLPLMSLLLEMLSYPFMQRALLSGLVLGALLASLGVFVTLRRMAFFGDGIAHASLAGIAIAILAGVSPLPVALAWAVAIALLVYRLERNARIPSDSLIGIFFTASMALGVMLMRFTRGYQPDLVSYLFGNILSIRTSDVLLILLLSAAILFWLFLSIRPLTFLSIAEDSAAVRGIPVRFHTIILYVSLAMATVLGVKILGIVLVSALLILPSATSRLLTQSFKQYFIFSLIIAELAVFIGLSASFLFDLPSGAAVVLAGTGMFFLAATARTKK